jgi:predicted aspartyl protease
LFVRYAFLAASASLALAAASTVGAATSKCEMAQIADLLVRAVPHSIIVDGEINGHKIGVMLDTGANSTLVLRSAAERLGLERHEIRGYQLYGIGGATRAESALVDEFRIGQASRKGWRMLVAGEHAFGGDVAVLLGEDFFDKVDVEFDLAHRAVRLFQPKNCDGVSLAYWTTEEPGEVAIEAVYDAAPQILLTVQINGQPIKALLDSGAYTSVLTKADAARLGVTPETPGVASLRRGGGLGEKQVDFWVGPFDSFVIGNERINNPQIRFGDLFKDTIHTSTGSRIARHVDTPTMLLGADFLRAHRVLISHSQRKIYFTYVRGPVFGLESPSETGTTARPDKGPRPESGEK